MQPSTARMKELSTARARIVKYLGEARRSPSVGRGRRVPTALRRRRRDTSPTPRTDELDSRGSRRRRRCRTHDGVVTDHARGVSGTLPSRARSRRHRRDPTSSRRRTDDDDINGLNRLRADTPLTELTRTDTRKPAARARRREPGAGCVAAGAEGVRSTAAGGERVATMSRGAFQPAVGRRSRLAAYLIGSNRRTAQGHARGQPGARAPRPRRSGHAGARHPKRSQATGASVNAPAAPVKPPRRHRRCAAVPRRADARVPAGRQPSAGAALCRQQPAPPPAAPFVDLASVRVSSARRRRARCARRRHRVALAAAGAVLRGEPPPRSEGAADTTAT